VEPDERLGAPAGSPRLERPRASRGPWLLCLALALVALALVWDRVGLSRRARALEEEALVLRSELASRERLIEGQRQRLEDVRGRVDDLRVLLEEPLSGAD
jgi:hypothetical protein